MKIAFAPFVLVFFASIYLFPVYGQEQAMPNGKNHLFVLGNYHLEKRGSKNYHYSNPDFSIGYERQIFDFGDHLIYGGLRTGFYREYILTGDGWSHPDKNRLFFGLSPSYMLNFSKNIRFQLNLVLDILLPNDYKETWSYWAIEPSMQYFIRNIYLGISATRGVYLFFDPKAHMAKAGIKAGLRF